MGKNAVMDLSKGLAGVVAFLTCILWIQLPEVGCWPEGTYGLPMAKSGCPAAKGFEWLLGSRLQKTEPKSHASTPIHLAGIAPEATDKIVQHFCMKTSYPKYNGYSWSRGKYCVFKKGECPHEFKYGWIYWDDAAPWIGSTIQNYSGVVPDGEYTRNTKIEFCCRNDGSASQAISLPSGSPFYLFKWGDVCQKVESTNVAEEWVYWADEDFINLNGQGGVHPKVHTSKYPFKYTKLYYCYYEPKPPNQSAATAMTVVFVLCGIIGVLFLIFLILFLVRKFCTRKQQSPPYLLTNADNAAREQSLRSTGGATRGAEPSVIYRPAANGRHPKPGSRSHVRFSAAKAPPPPDEEAEGYPPTPTVPVDYTMPPPDSELMPMMREGAEGGPEPPRISFPPSYEEVLREKEGESLPPSV